MQFSTKMRYGTRALVELAAQGRGSVVSVRDLADSQGISSKYLERIMRALSVAGLVKSVRGFRGGYSLAKPPNRCRLSEVYAALEGSMAPVECVDHPESCPMIDTCPTRETWTKLKEAMEGVLEDTTLQDLLDRGKERKGAARRSGRLNERRSAPR